MSFLDPFFSAMDKLATDFSWGRLVVFASFLCVLGLAVAWVEMQTALLETNRIERSISILRQLDELDSKKSVESGGRLEPHYGRLRSQFADLLAESPAQPSPLAELPEWLKQVLAAAVPWGLLLLFFLLRSGKDPSSAGASAGVLFAAILITPLAALLPASLSWSARFLWFPVGHFVVACTLIFAWGARRRAPQSTG